MAAAGRGAAAVLHAIGGHGCQAPRPVAAAAQRAPWRASWQSSRRANACHYVAPMQKHPTKHGTRSRATQVEGMLEEDLARAAQAARDDGYGNATTQDGPWVLGLDALAYV